MYYMYVVLDNYRWRLLGADVTAVMFGTLWLEQIGRYHVDDTWWRHQMETFSALLVICAGNSPVSGEFPAQRPVTRSFDVFFDLGLN